MKLHQNTVQIDLDPALTTHEKELLYRLNQIRMEMDNYHSIQKMKLNCIFLVLFAFHLMGVFGCYTAEVVIK